MHGKDNADPTAGPKLKDRRRASYNESTDEPASLINNETTDIEKEIPSDETTPVERIKKDEADDESAAFTE